MRSEVEKPKRTRETGESERNDRFSTEYISALGEQGKEAIIRGDFKEASRINKELKEIERMKKRIGEILDRTL